jgi:hypothetical protein
METDVQKKIIRPAKNAHAQTRLSVITNCLLLNAPRFFGGETLASA